MQQTFWRGVFEALPIVAGYTAFGTAFGMLAVKTGMPVLAATCMSLFVLAGSAQFVCLSLLSAGASIPVILSATFILNLRHVLFASSIAHHLPRIPGKWLPYLAHTITDESYGVNMARYSKQQSLNCASVMGTNMTAHLSWVVATWVGAALAQKVHVNLSMLNGALPILFAALLASQLKQKEDWIWLSCAAAGTAALLLLAPGNSVFLIVSLLIPTLALLWEKKK